LQGATLFLQPVLLLNTPVSVKKVFDSLLHILVTHPTWAIGLCLLGVLAKSCIMPDQIIDIQLVNTRHV
jgi:hypothetical protein